MEIERKFLFKVLPEHLENYACLQMEQAYISTNPVIRIRKKSKINAISNDLSISASANTTYILTVKSSGMMSRQEFELNIDESAYTNLLRKAEGNIITKNRYLIPLDSSLTLELDIFQGVFDGLVIGEIEFPDEESAKKYTPPEYISEEVTFDKRFHNSNLSSMNKQDISELISFTHKRSR